MNANPLQRRASELAQLLASYVPLTLEVAREAVRRFRLNLKRDEGKDAILKVHMSADFREWIEACLSKRNPCRRVSDRGRSAFPFHGVSEGATLRVALSLRSFSDPGRCDLICLFRAQMTLHRGVLRQKCCTSKRISVHDEFAAINATHLRLRARRLKLFSVCCYCRLSGVCSERPAARSTSSLEQIMCSADRRSSTCRPRALSSDIGKFRGSILVVFQLAFQQIRWRPPGKNPTRRPRTDSSKLCRTRRH